MLSLSGSRLLGFLCGFSAIWLLCGGGVAAPVTDVGGGDGLSHFNYLAPPTLFLCGFRDLDCKPGFGLHLNRFDLSSAGSGSVGCCPKCGVVVDDRRFWQEDIGVSTDPGWSFVGGQKSLWQPDALVWLGPWSATPYGGLFLANNRIALPPGSATGWIKMTGLSPVDGIGIRTAGRGTKAGEIGPKAAGFVLGTKNGLEFAGIGKGVVVELVAAGIGVEAGDLGRRGWARAAVVNPSRVWEVSLGLGLGLFLGLFSSLSFGFEPGESFSVFGGAFVSASMAGETPSA